MAFNAILRLEGIDINVNGASTPAAIEVSSFQWDMTSPVNSSTGGSAGRRRLGEFTITKTTDTTTPLLYKACASGMHISTGVLSVVPAVQTGPQVFLRYTFTDVFVSSINWGDNQGGPERPVESLSFVFESTVIDYLTQTPGT
jgi:type VI secretion system secreted protein Hcp